MKTFKDFTNGELIDYIDKLPNLTLDEGVFKQIIIQDIAININYGFNNQESHPVYCLNSVKYYSKITYDILKIKDDLLLHFDCTIDLIDYFALDGYYPRDSIFENPVHINELFDFIRLIDKMLSLKIFK